jgi:hypothetical protein
VPPKVEPAIDNGIRYVAPNDDGRRAYIEAWDVQTNKKLWDLTVFTTPIDPKIEEDVQWVFIKSLSIRDGSLLLTSERGNTHQIDLNTRTVKRSDSAPSQAPGTNVGPDDTPVPVKRAIARGLLAKEYEVSFQVPQFYLRGDFNGDGKIDVAVLAKQRSSGKRGIATIHDETDKITILGAGTTAA